MPDTFWTLQGRLVVDASGHPIICNRCPCEGFMSSWTWRLRETSASVMHTVLDCIEEEDVCAEYDPETGECIEWTKECLEYAEFHLGVTINGSYEHYGQYPPSGRYPDEPSCTAALQQAVAEALPSIQAAMATQPSTWGVRTTTTDTTPSTNRLYASAVGCGGYDANCRTGKSWAQRVMEVELNADDAPQGATGAEATVTQVLRSYDGSVDPITGEETYTETSSTSTMTFAFGTPVLFSACTLGTPQLQGLPDTEWAGCIGPCGGESHQEREISIDFTRYIYGQQ